MDKAAFNQKSGVKTGYLVVAAALVAVFLLSLIKIYDYDVWFHLKTGEYILSNHVIPREDVFSYTAYGKPWVTHEWLFELVLHLVYSAVGLKGLTLFKAAMITLTFAIGAVSAYRRGVSPYVIAIVAVIAAVLSRERFLERPELFSFLFVTFYIYLLERFRVEGGKALYLWAMPAAMIVWASSHAGAIFGLMIIGAYAFAEFLKLLLPPADFIRKLKTIEGSGFKTLVFYFFATSVAGLLNPNTYHVFTYPFLALKISKETGLHLAEYNPPTWSLDHLFFIFFALSVLVLIASFKRLKLPHIFIFILFSMSALKYNRSIAFWAITVFPIIAYYVDGLRGCILKKPEKASGSKEAAFTVIGVIAVALISFMPIKELNRQGNWGLGVKAGWFPEGALQFLDREGVKGNMYNSYEYGGYILWRSYPERKVFIDGRSDIYPEVLVDVRVQSSLGFENLVEKYGINYTILSYKPTTVDYVNADPYFGGELALVYWDDSSMVYLKRTPENAARIERHEYKRVRPTDAGVNVMDLNYAGEIIAELQRNIADNPAGWRNHLLLGAVYERLGEIEKARAQYGAARANAGLAD